MLVGLLFVEIQTVLDLTTERRSWTVTSVICVAFLFEKKRQKVQSDPSVIRYTVKGQIPPQTCVNLVRFVRKQWTIVQDP